MSNRRNYNKPKRNIDINEIIRENTDFSYFGNQATSMGNPVHTSDAYSKTESGEVEGIKNINNTGMATI